MRKTKLGLFVVMCAALLALLLTGCGGGGSASSGPAPDTARVEKTVLSAINKAAGKEWSNDESLRSKADVIWNKVDGQGKIQWINAGYSGTDPDGTYWFAYPIMNEEELDGNSKFQMIAFTEEVLKQYENPSEELLTELRYWVHGTSTPAVPETKSVCVTAKNIGGKVYVVYVTTHM